MYVEIPQAGYLRLLKGAVHPLGGEIATSVCLLLSRSWALGSRIVCHPMVLGNLLWKEEKKRYAESLYVSCRLR